MFLGLPNDAGETKTNKTNTLVVYQASYLFKQNLDWLCECNNLSYVVYA